MFHMVNANGNCRYVYINGDAYKRSMSKKESINLQIEDLHAGAKRRGISAGGGSSSG